MRKFFFPLILVGLVAASAFLATPAWAAGASLYLSPSTGTKILNSKFTVAIKISTGGQSINAGQASLTYDKSLLKVLSVAKGSVFSLWTEEPTFSSGAGTIGFGGGVPRPGYTGNGGTICVITFQAIKLGTAAVNFTSGDVLANDGMGTNILSSLGSASFIISAKVEAPTPEKPAPGQPTPAPTPAPVETAAYNRPVITSDTHPDQTKWYKAKTADFSWKLPDGATGVSVAFDQKAGTEPGNVPDGLFNSKQYTADHDGSWYIHVKVKDNKGRWGTTGHFRVNIDSTPPKDFALSVKQDDPNDWPTLYFQTTDELSGLDKYEILIDSLSAEPIVLTADKTSYKLTDLAVGSHAIAVKALDLAGNGTLANLTFEFAAVATPVIKSYSAEIKPGDKFFISGTANPNNTINIYLQGEGQAQPEVNSVKSDNDGNWFLVASKNYANGRYTAWVEAVNPNGLKSKPSAKVSFLVTAPIFARIGSFVLNYFTVLVSLLLVIILIVALLIWIWEFVRKKLKKETLEIEDVLEKNIEELKIAVSEEIDDLVKMNRADFAKGKARVKNILYEHIDATNKRILKEIKDVEKILK
ncbi:MAG: cohesin domain-containing protein [Patescibacteria group bacterium]|nr:cohesin domain-containing protein [Patescibacteria group bacterium]